MTDNNSKSDVVQDAVESRERWKRYHSGREHWTQEQLDPYMGKWAAFSSDGRHILASAEDLGDVYRILDENGIDAQDTMVDHLVFADESDAGGADIGIVAIPLPVDSDSGVGAAVTAKHVDPSLAPARAGNDPKS